MQLLSTARYDELVSVYRTQAKSRSDDRGCDEMVGKIPRCLTVKTAVHHDAKLVSDLYWKTDNNTGHNCASTQYTRSESMSDRGQ